MPNREHLSFLRQCEAEATERGHASDDPTERDLHFDYAAVFAAQIVAIEKQTPAG